MLKNEGDVLPLAAGTKIALFGRSQFCYYKSGTGSGGMVNTAYVVGIKEALESDERFELNAELMATYEKWLETHPFDNGIGWAQEPWFQEEMPVSEELAKKASETSDVAVIILGRTAGEDKDNKAEEGSYLLTKTEEEMVHTVCSVFKKTIVLLNVGNIIEMKWMDTSDPSAVLYVWQGGQEGGYGVLDVLAGDVNPSGKLPDTIAYSINDYPSTPYYGDRVRNIYAEDIYVGYRYFSTFAPEKVRYPFGFGLSYTTFAVKSALTSDCLKADGTVTITATVKNTGKAAGKEVVQAYVSAPQGALGKAARVLIGYAKTDILAPGEEQTLTIEVPVDTFASYDDSGATGNKSCYVLEAGDYIFYAGGNVRDAAECGSVSCEETIVVEKLSEAMAPVTAFECMAPGAQKADGTYELSWKAASLRTVDPMVKRSERLPEEYAYTGNLGYKLCDVESGKVTMQQFLAQLTNEELACIIRGEGMCSPKVTAGTAAAFGGISPELLAYGIPVGCCADGPSGIRMDCGTIAFAMPNGTLLASTFNDALVGELYGFEGMELRKNKVDTLLGPGVNIHRNPLNGRNFEYFSEDPLLTGKMAAAQLREMHKYDVTGTVKHFACNNQEFSRSFAEGVISERAIREIYLKGYEIAVKEGQARSIMSTYGPVNGLWTAGSYDLLTAILRDEWGYTGIVMTDWWAKANDEGGKATIRNTAAMVRAQNDLYMVTGDAAGNANEDNSVEAMESGKVTRGEYQRSAANICSFLLKSPAYSRLMGRETELDKELQKIAETESAATGRIIKVEMFDEVTLDESLIDTEKGKSTTIEVTVKNRGMFRLAFDCRAAEGIPGLAQLPVSVFFDKKLAETISITGDDKEWSHHEVEIAEPLFSFTFFIKLYFGISGMELRNVKVLMSQDMEEFLKAKYKAHREEQDK